ncbi:hypothetical protein [Streptomyces sp. NPDC020298]|uniref:hypothetical protein n=1 Tax=unclassified Streptomyces TaxID=2593676 RepID=UPI0033E9D026
MIKSIARVAMAGAAVATVLVGTTSTAQAYSNKTISLPGGRGTMTFYDDGDVFNVCDKKGYDIGQPGSHQMQLSWNGDGYDVKSEWSNE